MQAHLIYSAKANARAADRASAARLLDARPLAADCVTSAVALALELALALEVPSWVPVVLSLPVADCVGAVREAREVAEAVGVPLTLTEVLELLSDERYQFSGGSFIHSPMVTAL